MKTLEEALQYISQLESENKALREEVERYRSMGKAGRKKHDATWTASYNDFVVKYESGMTIMEIVNQSEISRWQRLYMVSAFFYKGECMQKLDCTTYR